MGIHVPSLHLVKPNSQLSGILMTTSTFSPVVAMHLKPHGIKDDSCVNFWTPIKQTSRRVTTLINVRVSLSLWGGFF